MNAFKIKFAATLGLVIFICCGTMANLDHIKDQKVKQSIIRYQELVKEQQNREEGDYPQVTISYSWDFRGERDWVETMRTETEYHDDGRRHRTTDFQPGATDPFHRTTLTYDLMLRETGYLAENYIGGIWIEAVKSEWTYDSNGNLYEQIYYNNTGGNWVIVYGIRNTYTYNTSDWVTEIVSEFNYGAGWNLDMKEIYTLDAMGYPTEIRRQWYQRGWVDENRYLDIDWYFYSPFTGWGQFAFFVQQLWLNNSWETDSRQTTTYNAQGGFVRLTERYDEGTWENYERESYILTKELPDEHKFELWEGFFWIQTSGSNYIKTYANLHLVELVVQEWAEELATREYVNTYRYQYSDFFIVTSQYEPPLTADRIKISPNPAHNGLYLFIDQHFEKQVRVELFDLTGQKVFEKSLHADARSNHWIDVSLLPNGLYFLNVKTGNQLVVKKFIKN